MVLPPFVAAFLGTSLTSGRLAADWVPTLNREIREFPEAVGPVVILNLGKGSQNSAWGVTQAPLLTALKPTHILFEGFAINDCIDLGAGPAITRAQHILNIQTMVAGWRAGIPAVDLTIQTMSSISAANAAQRPNLADYYADEIATGATLGMRTLDNYANWPKPLNPALTDSGDGLHPIWAGAVDTYLYPAIKAWARDRMAELWGLPRPGGNLDFSEAGNPLISVI